MCKLKKLSNAPKKPSTAEEDEQAEDVKGMEVEEELQVEGKGALQTKGSKKRKPGKGNQLQGRKSPEENPKFYLDCNVLQTPMLALAGQCHAFLEDPSKPSQTATKESVH